MMDPSDTVCIEHLKPKTVPEGLVALGTIIQISEIQLKLQITEGIICLVDRSNVNQIYTSRLHEYAKQDGGVERPPKLSELFTRGQQYVCKIIEKRTRKGYADAQDIIATLDPTSIQEDNLPSTLLAIPQVPLQCVIQSVEDHGYQVDVGFKGLKGFLKFKDSEEHCAKYNDKKKFLVGQVVRCYLKSGVSLEESTRVIHLTLKKSARKASKFSQEKVSHHELNERCILPGSESFLTVMKIKKDGLIVNFMNEFAGFVNMNHLQNEWHIPRENYKISDELDCSVLYYNSITKTFALSLRKKSTYKETLEHFIKNYHLGQIIKRAKVAYLNGSRSVVFKIDDKYKAIANVKDALDGDLNTMSKDELHLTLDATFPDDSKHRCRIRSINLADLVIVLSLRQEFLNLPCVSVEELKPADFIEVKVKKYVKEGIVVTFGLNLRAIILNPDLHDYISANSYKKYPIGKTIKCRVLKVDFNKQPARVYLTNKEQLMSPDLAIVKSCDKSYKGKPTYATINKVSTSGVVVEFFNNIKGFIPRRFLSSVPVQNVDDLFKVGQVLSCVIYRIDEGRGSLLVGAIPYETIVGMLKDKKKKDKTRKDMRQLSRMSDKIDRNIARMKVKKSLPSSGLAASGHNKAQKAIDTTGRNRNENPRQNDRKRKRNDSGDNIAEPNESSQFLQTVGGINWSASLDSKNSEPEPTMPEDYDDDVDSSSCEGSRAGSENEENSDGRLIKSRRQRSEEARLREDKLREAEMNMLDSNRPPQSVPDFERLLLKKPDSADSWTRYSKFFIDNVETEKARIVCRRALKTINFRLEKEKLKVWLHLIKIEAKYGGAERLREVIEEAAQTNDRLKLYQGAAKMLSNCGELEEAERLHEMMLKSSSREVEVWIDYIMFLMEHRKDLIKARSLFEKACKSLMKSDLVNLKSRFAQFEFRFGDVERGKTIFENLLSDNPRRTDLWRVFESMVKKYGTRQLDTAEVQQQNELILERIADSLQHVSKKARKTLPDSGVAIKA